MTNSDNPHFNLYRRRLGMVFALVVAGLCLASPVASQDAAAVDLNGVTARLETEIHKILEETGIPAISVALVRDGDVVWTGAYGYANVGASVRATTETYFSTGSTFKFVTATAIMQLVEKGDLELDTPLNEFVGPDLTISGADDVTFRHLLSHHSGLRGPVATVPLWSREAPRTPLELLEGTTRTGPPGEEYRYCNECYGIMAWVVEKVSNRSYDEYVAESILQPLGIDIASASVPTPAMVEHLALPYTIQDNVAVPTAQVRYDVYSAGDIYLRAEDMARFLAAQLNGGIFRGERILSEASASEMQHQQFDGQSYGLGTFVLETEGRLFLQHTGSIPGFNSFSLGEPATGMGVYIMSNSGSDGREIGPLSQLAMRLMGGEDPDPLPSFATTTFTEVALAPATFDEYVGEYQLAPGFILTVSREGSDFYLQANGQQRSGLFASSDVDFFLKVVEANLTFGRDDPDGPITHMMFRQGQEQRANKVR